MVWHFFARSPAIPASVQKEPAGMRVQRTKRCCEASAPEFQRVDAVIETSVVVFRCPRFYELDDRVPSSANCSQSLHVQYHCGSDRQSRRRRTGSHAEMEHGHSPAATTYQGKRLHVALIAATLSPQQLARRPCRTQRRHEGQRATKATQHECTIMS